ncbi:hypothetical protein RirG_006630 [Rhizophagus irregularis DAOM 197198w]|uniref:Uncharacterized protein n=1 Tax=Rhizophagus irregularis (strain DAOM 197198w) TaxID=1432141 RepID=A0A015M2V8_RHIIW|nr:hypothetical protein RirG_006630 [Rhizophagus irregularis DAOM 197198w]
MLRESIPEEAPEFLRSILRDPHRDLRHAGLAFRPGPLPGALRVACAELQQFPREFIALLLGELFQRRHVYPRRFTRVSVHVVYPGAYTEYTPEPPGYNSTNRGFAPPFSFP